MLDYPKVVIGVLTYGRPLYLPRVLACFDRLKYPTKRMVIINDCKYIKYTCSNPRVDILNIDTRMPLAAKRNMFTSFDWDILFQLDDDDLFLPNRIKHHVDIYRKDSSIDAISNPMCYITYGGSLDMNGGCATTNSSYTRAGFFKAGGYDVRAESYNAEDTNMRGRMLDNCNVHIDNSRDRADYVYWWHGSTYHATYSDSLDEWNKVESSVIEHLTELGLTNTVVDIVPNYKVYDNIVRQCLKVKKLGHAVDIILTENNTNLTLA